MDWNKKGLVEVLGKPENNRQKMKFVQNSGMNYAKEPYETTMDVSVGLHPGQKTGKKQRIFWCA